MRITLVHNPDAGDRGRDEETRLARLISNAGHTIAARSRGDDPALDAPADLVVVAGGDGTVGRVARSHQESESSACGALVALQQEIVSGSELPDLDPDDLEQGLLRRRLAFLWSRGPDLTVLEVTMAARDAIRQDVLRLHPALDPDGRSDVLLTTGVLVHAGDGDWVAAHETTRIHPDGRSDDVALGR